jgi:putative CocE/NonD family hydrolase
MVPCLAARTFAASSGTRLPSQVLPGLFIGANAGPRDQRAVESRHDVLCYTSEPLAEPVEVIGPVLAVLHVSSSALDTDFTAKLVDVAPDGRAESLADGILRARYRQSLSEPSPLEPERVYQVTVDLVATAVLFPAGHRIRLEISSSNFPCFDRNTNTGGVIAAEGRRTCARRSTACTTPGPGRPGWRCRSSAANRAGAAPGSAPVPWRAWLRRNSRRHDAGGAAIGAKLIVPYGFWVRSNTV